MKTAIRWIGLAAILMLTLEIAARLDDWYRYDADLLRPYDIETLFGPSTFGRTGVPGARFAKWRMNSMGFRGPEPVAGRPNIITFGASETFGMYESPDHEYPRILEDLLAKRGEPVNVLNAGIPGMRLGTGAAYLDDALTRTHARTVVIYPSPAHYIGVKTPYCGRPSRPVATPHGLLSQVRIAGKARNLIKGILPPGILDGLRRMSIDWEIRHESVLTRIDPISLETFRADLECAIDAVQGRDANAVLVTHATAFGDHINADDRMLLTAWRASYPDFAEEGFLDLENRANAIIRDVAMRRGLHLADAATGIPRGSEYFADFVHFTDKGARAMATLVSENIPGTSTERNPPGGG